MDFTGTPLGNPASLTIGIVTFSAQVGVLSIENTIGAAFGMTAPSLVKDNGAVNIQLVFSGPVSALAFENVTPFAGSILSVFSNNNFTGLLEAYAIPDASASSTFAIAGLADAGIRSATITGGSLVIAAYDNFKFVPAVPVVTPEPSAMYLLGTGLAALAGFARLRAATKSR